MSKAWNKRRRFRSGDSEYLLDDDDLTAWMEEGGSSKGARVFTLPDEVVLEGRTYRITSLGAGTYCSDDETGIEELTVPDSYEYIDEYALDQAPLKTVRLGKGMMYVHPWSFKAATDDFQLFIDPENPHIKLSDDGNMVLSKSGTELICLLKDVKDLVIPEGVEEIRGEAISCKSRLTHIKFPSTLKRIRVDGIIQNESLKSLVIPEGVTEIQTQALATNDALEEVDLPSTLQHLCEDAFMDDFRLRRLILRMPDVLPCAYAYYTTDPLYEICHLVVPRKLLPAYRMHPAWGWFKHIDILEDNT